jgi:DNA-binding XRE family transcriptional regulator
MIDKPRQTKHGSSCGFISTLKHAQVCTRSAMSLNRLFSVPFQTPNTAPPIAPLPQISTSWLSAERASSTYITDRFGIRLRTLRKARGMTQLEMSIEFGIDRSFISDVERGKKAISLPLLEVIAIGFGMSMSDLLSDV